MDLSNQTIEEIKKQIANLKAEQNQHIANVHMCEGAIRVLEELLKNKQEQQAETKTDE